MSQTGQNEASAEGSRLPTPPPCYCQQPQDEPAPARRVERRPTNDFDRKMPDLIWATMFILQTSCMLAKRTEDEYFPMQREVLQLRRLPAGENFDAAAKSVQLQVKMFELGIPKADDGGEVCSLRGRVYLEEKK